jgi:TetR/AcrR family transcriptional regulator
MDTQVTIGRTIESESRRRILEAAYRLFARHGYKAVSMQQIADTVPIHKATLYHHFRSKDEMFGAVVRLALQRMRAQVAEIVERGGPARDQLAAIAACIFENAQSDIGRLLTDVQEHLPVEERLAVVRDDAYPWDLYEELFRGAAATGEIRPIDPALATSMFIGLVHGQSWARKIGRIDAPLDASVAYTVVDTLFAGIQAEAAAISGD